MNNFALCLSTLRKVTSFLLVTGALASLHACSKDVSNDPSGSSNGPPSIYVVEQYGGDAGYMTEIESPSGIVFKSTDPADSNSLCKLMLPTPGGLQNYLFYECFGKFLEVGQYTIRLRSGSNPSFVNLMVEENLSDVGASVLLSPTGGVPLDPAQGQFLGGPFYFRLDSLGMLVPN